MGLGDNGNPVCLWGGRRMRSSHHSLTITLWLREIGLGVALASVLLLAVGVWHGRSDQQAVSKKNRQAICAIERYIEMRFQIDKAVPNISPAVYAERLRAIRRMEHDAGTDCHLQEAHR